ncbi:hypothetical protein, partial [Actinoplanes derwentensis]
PKRLRTERFNPSKDTIVDGTHLLRGEITTIDFTTRDFTADGKNHRSFDVALDLTSRDNQLTPEQLQQVADNVQNTIDQAINGKHTLPGGRQLHMQLSVQSTPWSDDLMTTWQDKPGSRPPVEITTDDTTHQHRWNPDDNPAVLVHEVMHYLGAKEGYHADHHLFNTQNRPGVMGHDA